MVTVCLRPQLGGNIEVAEFQRYYSPGVEIALSCKQGYTPLLGPRKIVCTIRGQWTKTNLICRPRKCLPPDQLTNGELYYKSIEYRSMINYTCNEGYVMTGSSTAVCQANGTWSTPAPECTPVSCGLPPIPEFGMIVYDRIIRGNFTSYGVQATYACRPPYALIGDSRAECTASGTWTKTPECQIVTCPFPDNIDNGYMTSTYVRDYDYRETMKYGCHGEYVLEGSMEIVCQEDGTWSEKPSCNAPCNVGINRGRILYNGRKIWIKDLEPKRILHKEILSVYCTDTARNCGYAVQTQCVNGTLIMPECFQGL
ncbi:beta-2-glycoprotein 1-like [Pholidichthys leucotaenia]